MNDILNLIKIRHSVRNFESYTLSHQEIKKITAYIKDLPMLDSKIQITWKIKHSSPLGSGKIYTEIPKQTSENLVEYGFQGENIVLFLTSLDFGTCWMAVGRATERLAPAVIVFGKQGSKNLYSHISRFVISSNKRKSLTLLLEKTQCQPTPEQENILETMRAAPSAVNRQPWLFEIQNENKIIVKKTAGHAQWSWINLGICLCHGYLMAKEIFEKVQVIRCEQEIYSIEYHQ